MAQRTGQPKRSRQVAVIGSGIAGLSAAHVLHAGGATVTLYEAADRAGGHAHTHDVDDGTGPALAVDSGFIVYNNRTYPLLTRLFDELGVSTQPCEMSLSVSCDGCGLEYAGARGPAGLRRLAPGLRHRPPHGSIRMLAEILRFHRIARRFLKGDDDHSTIGELMDAKRFSTYFQQHFLVPLISAVWSCAPGTAKHYPARYLFVFLDNHGMLALRSSPQWRTVVGGSRAYVERVVKPLHAVHLETPVRLVHRGPDGVHLLTTDGDVRQYDAAVIATHADQALRMLVNPSDSERRLLGSFRYSCNPTVLHTDTSVLPSSKDVWASWNYRLDSCSATADQVRVNYHMNRLQRLDARRQYVVSLNAKDVVGADRIIARTTYEHPIFTRESVAAQRELSTLNTATIAFAGAHHGWGFHEDGCRAGVDAAAALGVTW